MGVGGIWKFGYVGGRRGGGGFLVMFIVFSLLIGVGLLMGELIMGRKSEKDGVEW